MICPMCCGDGWVLENITCDACNGTGIVAPLTEQEYLQTCDTEQLAEFLACVEARKDADYNEETKAWVEWLKQPHNSPK